MPDLFIRLGEMFLYKPFVFSCKFQGGCYSELPEKGCCVGSDPPYLFYWEFSQIDMNISSRYDCKSMGFVMF